MTVPAKVVTAGGEILTSPINIAGAGIHTVVALFDVLKNTAKAPLKLSEKNPLKKATWKAIGDDYRTDWIQYISHQKKRFNDYIAPVKKDVWNKTKRPSKALGNIIHAATGGLEVGVVTALDSTWRGIKTPFAAIGNIFKKKENRTQVWKNYKEKNKTRLQKFKDGFDQLNSDKELFTEDAKKKIEEALHSEEKEESKKEEKRQNDKKEENKQKNKKENEINKNKKKEKSSTNNDNSKEEQEKEKSTKLNVPDTEKEMVSLSSEEIFSSVEKIAKESAEVKNEREKLIQKLKENNGEMTEENKKLYNEREKNFQESFSDNKQKDATIALDVYKAGILANTEEKKYADQCRENAISQIDNYLARDISPEQKKKYETLKKELTPTEIVNTET